MKKLFVVTIDKDYLDECLGYIIDHTNECKKEPGNIISESFRSTDDPCVVYLLSDWATPEDEQRHANSDADHAFIARMAGKEAAPPHPVNWTQLA